MKKILLAAVASTAVFATPAFAQATDSTSFDVDATVDQTCLIEEAADVNFGSIELQDTNVPGPNSLQINNGSETGTGSNQDIWISCNYGAKMTASSGSDGMFNSAGAALVATDPDDFTDKIHYRIEITHANLPFLQLQTDSAGNSKSVSSTGAFHDEASLKVYIDGDDNFPKRPVAGSYTDIATITLGPV